MSALKDGPKKLTTWTSKSDIRGQRRCERRGWYVMVRRNANLMPRRFAEPSKSAAELRSRTMRAVKSKDTAPEIAVRRFLHAAGLRYRLHDQRLPGTPDLVFPSKRVALFVHGCFWHQHPGCVGAARPRSRQEYWTRKLDGNVMRDRRQRAELQQIGWKPLVIWECETSERRLLMQLANTIRRTHQHPQSSRKSTKRPCSRRAHT